VNLFASTGALAGSAKILLYHHVSSETPASTSVTPEVFDSHLQLLEESGYQVVPLAKIVDTLVNGGEFDSKWVAITFDDAYESVLSEAAPRLRDRNWPYTVFTNTDLVGKGVYLGWDQLRELEAAGASIANHTRSHEHMVRLRAGESSAAWRERLTRDVIEAQTQLEDELQDPLRLFAYPFGEFTAEISQLLQSLGFISFGQQSGPVGSTTNLYAIPRFPLGTGFDSVSSLAEKLRTEHLPLVDPPVPASLLEADADAPVLTLHIKDVSVRQGSLNCFVAGQPNARVVWLDDQTVEIQSQRPLGSGRSKYTCTAPHPTIRRAYFWHTHLWIKPRRDGSWYQG
jgi:peptidoglycan/xylan/chitin deacetylase (PgdA/CDA1 family)